MCNKEGGSGKSNHEGCLSVCYYCPGLSGSTQAPEGESYISTVLGASRRLLNFEDDVHPQDRLMLLAGQ